MPFNIMAQCSGLIILVVVMCFYATRKRLPLRTSRAFIGIWVITLLCPILDIASHITKAVHYYGLLHPLFVKLLAKTFVVSFIWETICIGIYVCADFLSNKRFRSCRISMFLIGLLSTLAIFSLPINIHSTSPFDTYTYGPAITVTYTCMFVITAIIMLITIFNHKKINPNRRQAVYIWFCLWLMVALVQNINRAILLSSLATSVSVLIMYIKIENPDILIDTDTGLFNEKAFIQYTNQLISQGKEIYMFMLMQKTDRTENFSATEIKEIEFEIATFLENIPGAIPFRLSNGKTVLILNSREDLRYAGNAVRTRFSKGWGKRHEKHMTLTYFYINEPFLMDTAIGYLDIFRYATNLNQKSINLDSETVKNFYSERQVEDLILKALDENRVEVFYQPIYSTTKKKFVSAEALTRIRDKDGKIVMPGVFIDVAEKNGLIVRLGEAIFRQVCKFISENDIQALGLDYIEVNLSTIEGCLENLPEKYGNIMKEYKVDPKLINLEITETASADEKMQLIKNMNLLREKGVRFSLDDFGTGQSNLNYIIDMPVDIVKFDHSFTKAYFEDSKAKFVTEAAISMIHGLDLHVVIEGVETKEQLDHLSDIGIRYIQGFYLSHPLPKDEFIKFLKDHLA